MDSLELQSGNFLTKNKKNLEKNIEIMLRVGTMVLYTLL